jgi:hypothetical protein
MLLLLRRVLGQVFYCVRVPRGDAGLQEHARHHKEGSELRKLLERQRKVLVQLGVHRAGERCQRLHVVGERERADLGLLYRA